MVYVTYQPAQGKEVQGRLRKTLPRACLHSFRRDGGPPQTKYYSTIGTAFDYLLRFHVKHVNPDAESRSWVAEAGLDRLRLLSGGYGQRLSDGKIVKVNPDGSLEGLAVLADEDGNMQYRELGLEQAEKRYARTVSDYQQFLKDGEMHRNLMRGTLFLAQLDPIFRADKNAR